VEIVDGTQGINLIMNEGKTLMERLNNWIAPSTSTTYQRALVGSEIYRRTLQVLLCAFIVLIVTYAS
jgi:hypothetical protein